MAAQRIICLSTAVLLHLNIASAGRTQRVLASPDIPITAFSCTGRHVGYYADLETNCQVYHMCGEGERQYSYMCPNTTLFHQRMLICAHWYQVNCSRSELDYSANLLIGQRDKPFVPDYFSGLGEDGIDNSNELQSLSNRRESKSYPRLPKPGHDKKHADLQLAGSSSLFGVSSRQNSLPRYEGKPARATTPSTVTSRPTNVSFRSTIETPSSDPALARTQPMTRPPSPTTRSTIETPSSDPALARTQPMTRPPSPTTRTILRPRRPSADLEPPDTRQEEGNTLELHLEDPRRAFFIPEGRSQLPKDEPIVVSIRLSGESHFEKPSYSSSQNTGDCHRCHPLFIIDRVHCSPCVLTR